MNKATRLLGVAALLVCVAQHADCYYVYKPPYDCAGKADRSYADVATKCKIYYVCSGGVLIDDHLGCGPGKYRETRRGAARRGAARRGAGRDGTGRDGTGRDGTGRDEAIL